MLCSFFKDSLNQRAGTPTLELNEGNVSTFAKFEYECSSLKTEQVFEKTNIACFCLHFGKFNFRAKLYSLSITNGAKRLQGWHPRGILDRNLFCVYPWPYIKYANIYDTPKCFLFCGYQLNGKLFCFFTFTRQSICRCHKQCIAQLKCRQSQKCM